MYERYTHTERTTIERGDSPPLTMGGVVCILWVFFCLLMAFVFAVTDGLWVALGIGGIGLLGLALLLGLAAIPNAKTARLDAPVDSVALAVRSKEMVRR